MTDKQLSFAFAEAKNYTDPDAFISDRLLSSASLPEDETAEPNLSLIPALTAVWHTANDDFRGLLRRMDLTQSGVSRRYCIPLRTVQNWCLGERTPPPYVRLLLALASGYIPA